MAHRTYNTSTLCYDDEKHQFYNSIVAKWKDKRAEIYREYEDGKCYSRYVHFINISGYLVTFPKEKKPYSYYGNEIQQEKELEECRKMNIGCEEKHISRELILEKEPTFKYLLKKLPTCGMSYLLKIIHQYRTNKEIEALVEINQFDLASNKQLAKLSKEEKRQVIEYVKANPERFNMKLKIIQIAIANKCTYEEAELVSFLHDVKLIKVYRTSKSYSIQEFLREYNDYKKSLIYVGHNIEDDYWKYPSDFKKQFDKVKEEENRKLKIEKELKAKERNKIYFDTIKNIQKEELINGYLVYVPTTIEDIIEQAEKLNQCLVTADYISKVIAKKSILVFIKKEQERIGTFEIDYDKKILQAYTNENSRNDCYFSPELKNIAKQFLNGYQVC